MEELIENTGQIQAETPKRPIFETKESKIAEAERLKLEGNRFFAEKDYKKALSCYAKVFPFLNGFQHKDDELYKYAKSDSRIDDEQLNKIQDLKYTTYLNMSQIDLYNKNYKKCVERATNSLKIKETAKGFFRRGCAFLELGDLDAAKEDFKWCLELEPDNAGAKEKLVVIKGKEKELDKGLMKKLKGMFWSDE